MENKSRISMFGGKYGPPGNAHVSFELHACCCVCDMYVDREFSTEHLRVAMALSAVVVTIGHGCPLLTELRFCASENFASFVGLCVQLLSSNSRCTVV